MFFVVYEDTADGGLWRGVSLWPDKGPSARRHPCPTIARRMERRGFKGMVDEFSPRWLLQPSSLEEPPGTKNPRMKLEK